MNKEDGMISISMLIVLSLMAVFSLYIYRLSLTENDSLEILKMNMQTKNYTISESLKLIDIRIVLVKIFTCKKSSTRVHF